MIVCKVRREQDISSCTLILIYSALVFIYFNRRAEYYNYSLLRLQRAQLCKNAAEEFILYYINLSTQLDFFQVAALEGVVFSATRLFMGGRGTRSKAGFEFEK
jgi:hypothetical protein